MNVEKKLYGRPLSTIFGSGEKAYFIDDDPDPIVNELRMLNYRYVRLFFHQQKDKFLLFNGWKDPNWTNTRAVKTGLDSDEKSVREVVFGRNDIDIEQKSVGRLLMDEVGSDIIPKLVPWVLT
jgi:cation-transporting P-type ATPase 13A2